MKKTALLLSPIMALAMAPGAFAGIEDPMYRPGKGQGFATIDPTFSGNDFSAREKIGYGFTDKFEILGSVKYSKPENGKKGFDNFNIGASYRLVEDSLLADIYGGYESSINSDVAAYGKYDAYTAGTRIGARRNGYTVAARAEYTLVDPENSSKNLSQSAFGAAGLQEFGDGFEGLLDVEYKRLDSKDSHGRKIDDPIFLTAQMNYVGDRGFWSGTWSVFYKTDLAGDFKDAYGLKYGFTF